MLHAQKIGGGGSERFKQNCGMFHFAHTPLSLRLSHPHHRRRLVYSVDITTEADV